MKNIKLVKTLIVIMILSSALMPLSVKAEENQQDKALFIQMATSSQGPGINPLNQYVKLPVILAGEFLVEVREEQILKEAAKRSFTEEELYILAHVICGEAQCYSDEEQLYVGSVVLNRVSSEYYPNSIKEVVFQQNQYACTRDGNYYRMPTERNWSNARYLLENGSVLPENVVYQSGAKQGKGVYLKTAKHYYCYR